jgi:hypothetical protein
MQFDELCALVGALQDRVAELEAKVAKIEGRNGIRPQVVVSGGERWRVDAVSTKQIQRAVADGVARGMVQLR